MATRSPPLRCTYAVLIESAALRAFIFATATLLLGIWCVPLYTEGDQQHYIRFFNEVSGLGWREAFVFYRNTLGTSEPGYFLIIYLLAPFVQKSVLVHIANFTLAYLTALYATRLGARAPVLCLLAVNFYLMVLFLSAERLKFSLILLLMSFSFRGVGRYVFMGASLLVHVQSALLILSSHATTVLSGVRKLLRGKAGREMILIALAISLLLLVAFLLREHISAKFSFYSASAGLQDAAKALVFMGLSLYCGPGRWREIAVAFAPVVIAALLVGSDRINIFAYFVFLYYGLSLRGGMNVPVILTGLYFSYKGLEFIARVLQYNQGFMGA